MTGPRQIKHQSSAFNSGESRTTCSRSPQSAAANIKLMTTSVLRLRRAMDAQPLRSPTVATPSMATRIETAMRGHTVVSRIGGQRHDPRPAQCPRTWNEPRCGNLSRVGKEMGLLVSLVGAGHSNFGVSTRAAFALEEHKSSWSPMANVARPTWALEGRPTRTHTLALPWNLLPRAVLSRFTANRQKKSRRSPPEA